MKRDEGLNRGRGKGDNIGSRDEFKKQHIKLLRVASLLDV